MAPYSRAMRERSTGGTLPREPAMVRIRPAGNTGMGLQAADRMTERSSRLRRDLPVITRAASERDPVPAEWACANLGGTAELCFRPIGDGGFLYCWG